jgi:ABC-type branched-subunit amino acid transport system ATPase component
VAAGAHSDASMHAMLDGADDDVLAELGVADIANGHCAALSYGDAKRVELALALVRRPKLLLMDEPTAGMAPRSRRELMQLAVDLATARGAAILFTEHDMDIVFGFARRVIVLNLGVVIADGPPAEVQARHDVQAAYLGQ